jgi:hypothetical protein
LNAAVEHLQAGKETVELALDHLRVRFDAAEIKVS